MVSISTFISAFLFLSVFGTILCVDVEFGHCPDLAVQSNFRPEQFAGFWYEIEDYHSGFLGKIFDNEKCNTVNLTLINATTVYINSSFVTNDILQRRVRRFREGRMNNINETAKWTVFTRPDLDESYYTGSIFYIDYYILETDYTSYALVWGCSGNRYLHSVNAWILSRGDTLSYQTLKKIHDNLGRYGLNRGFFRTTTQKGCQY